MPVDPEHLAPLGRRSLIATLGVFAGVTVVVVAGSSMFGAVHEQREAEAEHDPAPEQREVEGPLPIEVDPSSLALLGPLATGEHFEGWAIAEVEPLREGALPLQLIGPDAARVSVELRPLDSRSPPPPASSDRLAVYVRNRVSQPRAADSVEAGASTPEQAMAAARALAEALRMREQAGAPMPELAPLLLR